MTFALPGGSTRATVVQIDGKVRNVSAVRIGPLVIQLAVADFGGRFKSLAAPLLFLFVDPGPLFAREVKFATRRSLHHCEAPRLVPLAGVHAQVLNWLLVVVFEAEVLVHRLVAVLLLAEKYRTAYANGTGQTEQANEGRQLRVSFHFKC